MKTMTTNMNTITIHGYAHTVPTLRDETELRWKLTLAPGSYDARHVRHLYRTVRRDGLDPTAARHAVVQSAIAFGMYEILIP